MISAVLSLCAWAAALVDQPAAARAPHAAAIMSLMWRILAALKKMAL
jgi:hypothetical protein